MSNDNNYWTFLDYQRKLLAYAEWGQSLTDVFKWFGVAQHHDINKCLKALREVADAYWAMKAKEGNNG